MAFLIPSKQLFTVWTCVSPPGLNPCAVGNGGCEQLCLLSAVREEGYSCACADGHMALNGDSSLCTLADDTATPATEPNGMM